MQRVEEGKAMKMREGHDGEESVSYGGKGQGRTAREAVVPVGADRIAPKLTARVRAVGLGLANHEGWSELTDLMYSSTI
jgi:hypothetical protein